MAQRVLCIGSVLWDVIGRSAQVMRQGSDVPGRITQIPGGVALNIAMTLVQFGMEPVLLTHIGRDALGDALMDACAGMGLETAHVFRTHDVPTDRYMAIEGGNGLIAALADAHGLEAVGERIIAPLLDGTLGSADAPFAGPVALDGNLTPQVLQAISTSPAFAAADLRVAPASPGKAERLLPFVEAGRGTLYVNLEEAGLLYGAPFCDAAHAAQGLVARGAARVLVTDGARAAAKADRNALCASTPPQVNVTRITGAGDTFMAAHIAAEYDGAAPRNALERALIAAATYVSGADL